MYTPFLSLALSKGKKTQKQTNKIDRTQAKL